MWSANRRQNLGVGSPTTPTWRLWQQCHRYLGFCHRCRRRHCRRCCCRRCRRRSPRIPPRPDAVRRVRCGPGGRRVGAVPPTQLLIPFFLLSLRPFSSVAAAQREGGGMGSVVRGESTGAVKEHGRRPSDGRLSPNNEDVPLHLTDSSKFGIPSDRRARLNCNSGQPRLRLGASPLEALSARRRDFQPGEVWVV